MTLDDAPDGSVVNSVVAVNNAIAKAYDAAKTCNAGGRRGVGLRQPVQGFADDLKFTFDGPATLTIALVIGKTAPFAPLADAATGFQHIKQKLLRVVVHKRADEWPQLHGESMGCESTVL